MTDVLSHRWPDDEGFFVDDIVSLGQRRLSIIDLSWWHQPMKRDGYVIVFNGEIYNYQKIKKKLIALWYSFQTASDTEVLLVGYIAWGEKVLLELNGMFAFAIYDKYKNAFFVARDRLWIKPFYYLEKEWSFAFASEIKSLLLRPWFVKNFNKSVLNSYFQYRYVLGDQTYFSWIQQLLPGFCGYFDLSTKKLSVSKYRDLPIVLNKKDEWIEYYKEMVAEGFRQSVSYRMIADVPVGAYLSWWLDSSLVVAMMTRLSDTPVNTYTIWFEDEWYNEFAYAQMVADHCNSQHHQILLSWNDYISEWEKLIRYKDGPLSVPNEIPLYLMSADLRKDITVVLSWEWADELFCWYGRIFKLYIEYARSWHEYSSFLDCFLDRYNYMGNDLLHKILWEHDSSYSYNIFSSLFSSLKELPLHDVLPYVFQKIHLPWLLGRVDMTTMATSIEARVPFVDHEFVEQINAIPFHHKIWWNVWWSDIKAIDSWFTTRDISENLDTTKMVLRESLWHLLPGDILTRKKVWFPVPLDNRFSWDFVEYARKILCDDRCLSRWLYDSDYLRSDTFFDDMSGMHIWMMINMEKFLRLYFD